MNFMNKLLLPVCCCLMTPFLSSCFAQGKAKSGKPTPVMKNASLSLVVNGGSAYTIALAADAIPAEKTAAEQLQKYLQQVTGATLPIAPETQVQAGAPQILVGAGTRVKSLLPLQKWDALGSDGIVIKTTGNTLILAGGRPRGSLYAVFQFLEDSVGCRWWTPTESTIPTRKTLAVAAQNVTFVPPFNYREHFTTSVRYNPEFATIMRENGHNQSQTAEWGGHHRLLGFVHTFSELLPPEKYFKEHPEWFTDPANGNLPCTAASKMPPAQGTQLDLANAEMQDELTKQALLWIEKEPDAGYISITQNDNDNYCTCPVCSKITAAEGTPSGPQLKFVNEVAVRIGQKYPDFKVENMAYGYTILPPKTIRPASNVIIRLAMNFTDFGHPIDSEFNIKSRDNFLNWAKISKSLFVWTYVANFQRTIMPHPTWAGLAADARFFAANKVEGVFAQGDCYTNGVGDFVQLRAWLMGKLLWDPRQDQDKLINEFLKGYYGPAAPHLRAYLDVTQRAFLAQKRGITTGNTDYSYFNLDVVNESLGHFAKAKAAVKDDSTLAARVKRDSLSLDLVVLARHKFLLQEAQRSGKAFASPADLAEAGKEFKAAAKSFGVERYSELDAFDTAVDKLLKPAPPAVPLPAFLKDVPVEDIIDIQPSQMTLYLKGVMSDIEPDAAAAGKVAATMKGGTVAWSIQAKFGSLLEKPNEKWHIYAYARVDAKPGVTWDGNAFDGAIFNDSNMSHGARFNFPWKEAVGDTFKQFDLGVHSLTGGMMLYFAPKNIPQVEKVYVERVILVRAKD